MIKNESIRYEKKFVVPFQHVYGIEAVLATHPAGFSEIYEKRIVNNIYFDTLTLGHYQTHVNGASERVKIRIRWYGEQDTELQPVLELKARVGDVGYKKLYPLKSTSKDDLLDKQKIKNVFSSAGLSFVSGIDLSTLKKTLSVIYTRSYWISRDKHFRVTVDRNVKVADLRRTNNNMEINSVNVNDNVVLELKYDPEHQDSVQAIGQYLPWRQTRNSKYVMGIERLKVR